jgi:hypothetical protein
MVQQVGCGGSRPWTPLRARRSFALHAELAETLGLETPRVRLILPTRAGQRLFFAMRVTPLLLVFFATDVDGWPPSRPFVCRVHQRPRERNSSKREAFEIFSRGNPGRFIWPPVHGQSFDDFGPERLLF